MMSNLELVQEDEKVDRKIRKTTKDAPRAQ